MGQVSIMPSHSAFIPTRIPARAMGFAPTDALLRSWSQLRQLWLLATAHLDPLAATNENIASVEDMVRKQLVRLLNADDADADRMFLLARLVRDGHVGTQIDMRAAIDVGNVCRVNCHYCPMRRDNLSSIGKDGRSTTTAYRATAEKMVEVAEHAYELGFRELFLQSGEDTRLVAEVLKAVKIVSTAHPDFNITLNLGALPNNEYQSLRQAGARNYLIKHETANPILHEQQREETLRHRVDHMIKARKAGFEIGSGIILGFQIKPTKTWQTTFCFSVVST